MKRTIIIVVITTSVNKLFAQERPEAGMWFSVQVPVNFSRHWQWYSDASYRTFGISGQPLQYYFRTGMRRIFNKKWNTTAGVAFFFTKTDFDKENHEFGHEFRLWEEGAYQHLLSGKLTGMFRLRTEQRFFAATNVRSDFTGYRFRFRFGLNQKLSQHWGLQLTDEYMQQYAHQEFSFDQNRLTFSGMYYFTNTDQLQVGYLWLKWPEGSQHILTIQFTKNISLHGE